MATILTRYFNLAMRFERENFLGARHYERCLERWGNEELQRLEVQLQKCLSKAGFEAIYGIEEKCRAMVSASRWPNGFECPVCGRRVCGAVKTRGLFQCSTCRRQTSPIGGTIFASAHLPPRLWFRAMYHLIQSKQGMSSIESGRRLGVTQTAARKIKLAPGTMERDTRQQFNRRVELDDAYLGGERSGGKRGRRAAGKAPFVAAVETKPVRLKPRRFTWAGVGTTPMLYRLLKLDEVYA